MAGEFRHKNIHLVSSEYLGKKAYFLTFCTPDPRKILTSPDVCGPILKLLKAESTVRDFAILAYCAMPDHLHVLADGLLPTSDLLGFVKSFRIKSSRQYSKRAGQPLWQKKYYDHIVRSIVSLESVAWYIWLNPVRAGRCDLVEEFPFAGSFAIANPFRKRLEIIWEPEWKRS